jgi:hypothetical protein
MLSVGTKRPTPRTVRKISMLSGGTKRPTPRTVRKISMLSGGTKRPTPRTVRKIPPVTMRKTTREMARREGVEPPTLRFEAWHKRKK